MTKRTDQIDVPVDRRDRADLFSSLSLSLIFRLPRLLLLLLRLLLLLLILLRNAGRLPTKTDTATHRASRIMIKLNQHHIEKKRSSETRLNQLSHYPPNYRSHN